MTFSPRTRHGVADDLADAVAIRWMSTRRAGLDKPYGNPSKTTAFTVLGLLAPQATNAFVEVQSFGWRERTEPDANPAAS
jgi:hypothetical protein